MISVLKSENSVLDDIFESLEKEDLKTCCNLIKSLKDINSIHSQLCIGVIHAATAIPCTNFAKELFKTLIKLKIDVNLNTGEGYSPLDIAVSNNRIQIVKYLLKHNANPSQKTLELAQEFNNATCEQLIKDALTISQSGYDTDILVKELKKLGLNPGPITKNTKHLYIKYRDRHKLKEGTILLNVNKSRKLYSPELEYILSKELNWSEQLNKFNQLENEFNFYFENKNNQENQTKTFFTYLLLNSKITQKLPKLQNQIESLELFKIFLNSIFYIGKGTNARPYSHLHEAKICLEKNLRPKNEKTRKIVSLWNENFGIICLTVFRNISQDEAFSREFCMISAIGLDNLTNEIQSNFYKNLKWTNKQKNQLGCYLLFKCFKIHLYEGERPLLCKDIG